MNQIPSPYKEKLEELTLKNQWAIECPDCGSLMPDTKACIRGANYLYNLLLEGGDEFDKERTRKDADASARKEGYSPEDGMFQHYKAGFKHGRGTGHDLYKAKYQARIAELEARVKHLEILVASANEAGVQVTMKLQDAEAKCALLESKVNYWKQIIRERQSTITLEYYESREPK